MLFPTNRVVSDLLSGCNSLAAFPHCTAQSNLFIILLTLLGEISLSKATVATTNRNRRSRLAHRDHLRNSLLRAKHGAACKLRTTKNPATYP